MVLADLLRERLEGQREQRRAEGRAEEREKWAAWNVRRLAAEENGQHFDEPPPRAEPSSDRSTNVLRGNPPYG